MYYDLTIEFLMTSNGSIVSIREYGSTLYVGMTKVLYIIVYRR